MDVRCNAFASHDRRQGAHERRPKFIRNVVRLNGMRSSKRGVPAPHVLIRAAQDTIQPRGFPRSFIPSKHFK